MALEVFRIKAIFGLQKKYRFCEAVGLIQLRSAGYDGDKMPGKVENPEMRAQKRELWARQHIPGYMVGEVRPLIPLLSRENDLVLVDVGANKGFWTKAFLYTFRGHVRHSYMLDPSPENFAELSPRPDSLLFDEDDFQRISAHNVAASSSTGVATLYSDEGGSPMASLYSHKMSGEAGALFTGDDAGGLRTVRLSEELPVSTTTVDLFVSANNIEHIDVLKIDTEGHEYDVLLGARNSLLAGMVDCVFFEFGCHQVESRHFFVDFFRLFDELGYEIYLLTDGRLVPIPVYSYQYENFSGTFTFAARRKSARRLKPPEGFTEESYFKFNPDVERAVKVGQLTSGLDHWFTYGAFEGRRWK